MIDPDLLKAVPLFARLGRAELEALASATQTRSYGPNETIVEMGDAGRALYVVLKGGVRVLYPARSADFELARLGPGDFFGEMALLNDKPRSATVRAVDGVTVAFLEKSAFRRVLQSQPGVAFACLEEVSDRLRTVDERISGLSARAVRDTLTGLLNQRAFHDRLAGECDRTRRYGDPFALVLLDLDRFQGVNDALGHDAGDRILAWVGRILGEHTRAADTPFRIGGEEFAVLCPATSGETAGVVARRLVEVVAEARPPLEVEAQVTMSGGVASCPVDGDTPETLYESADDALLQAKEGGRNRIRAPGVTAE